MDEGLETAWAELHDANDSLHCLIGRPDYDPHLEVSWQVYAFDPTEKAKMEHRAKDWSAV